MDSIEFKFVPLEHGKTAIHAVAWTGNKRKCLVTTLDHSRPVGSAIADIHDALKAEFLKDGV